MGDIYDALDEAMNSAREAGFDSAIIGVNKEEKWTLIKFFKKEEK